MFGGDDGPGIEGDGGDDGGEGGNLTGHMHTSLAEQIWE